MLQIVRRWPRGLVGVRVIETDERAPARLRTRLRLPVTVGTDPESSRRPAAGRVVEPERFDDSALDGDERAAALVGNVSAPCDRIVSSGAPS